jgi:hypothetical protein
VLFHYDDDNPKREEHHEAMESSLRSIGARVTDLKFTEQNPVISLGKNMSRLRDILGQSDDAAIVLDISVFTKRHLLMMLRWLDDEGIWKRLAIVYTEPEGYQVSRFVPLSFGLASFQEIPGFSACPNLSRPVHLVLFLGYEGDRALAVYEHVQPMQTTLVVPHPPFRPEWAGRTEEFNADLLRLVGGGPTEKVDAIDPDETTAFLERTLGHDSARSPNARLICPLGTKPQTLGVYAFVRGCCDPPAVVYAGPLRHNHTYFSYGVGPTWIVKQAQPA